MPPESRDVQADPLAVVPVHQKHLAHDGGDHGADGGADPLPPHTQGDADEGVAHSHRRIHKGAEAVHIHGRLYFNAQSLAVAPHAGKHQDQGNGVVRGELRRAHPQHHEGPPHSHKSPQHTAQNNELQPSGLGEQGVQLPHRPLFRHNAVHPRDQHAADDGGDAQKISVQLRRPSLKIPRRKNYILCFTFMDTIRGGAICLSPIVGTENYSFSPFDGYEDQ